MNFKRILQLLSSISLMILSTTASATSFLTPPAGDKAVELIIKPLFGELSGLGGADPLMNVIGVFNSIALIVGGILVVYTLVAGTMSSAHDGEVLGKRWSSLWLPIRTALGAAAIFPINGGYCFLQKVIMWLALMGIGGADALWSKYIENYGAEMMNKIPFSSQGQKSKVKHLLQDMLVFNTCEESVKKTIDLTQFGDAIGLKKVVSSGANGQNMALTYYSGSCGIVALSSQRDETTSATDFDSKPKGIFSSVYNVNTFSDSLRPVHNEQMLAANEKIKLIAIKIVDKSATDEEISAEIKSTFESISTTWTAALEVEAKSQMKALEPQAADFMKSLSKEGFLFAGAWYMELAKSQDAITRAVSNYPNGTNGLISYFEGGEHEKDSAPIKYSVIGIASSLYESEAEQMMKKAKSLSNPSVASGVSSLHTYTENVKDSGDETTKILEYFISDGFNPLDENNAPEGNPIFVARGLGTNMVSMSVTAIALAVAGSYFAPAIGAVLTMLCGPLLVSGALMAYYLPMLPMILWVGAIFGWIVLLIEAIIAAPIWGVSWLAPDADGVVGKGGQGYMLVLSLTLRPPLMVLGFISALVVMDVAGSIVNEMFLAAFASGKSPSSLTAVVGIIAGCLMYATFMLSIINRVFSLIHVVPDKILRWIGIAGGELGQEAHAIESTTTSKALAGVAAAQGISSTTSQMATNKGLSNAREKGDNERQRRSRADAAENAVDQASYEYNSAAGKEAETARNLEEATNHSAKTGSLQNAVQSAQDRLSIASAAKSVAEENYSSAISQFGPDSIEAQNSLSGLRSSEEEFSSAQKVFENAKESLSRHEAIKPSSADIANLRMEHRNANFEKMSAESRLKSAIEKKSKLNERDSNV